MHRDPTRLDKTRHEGQSAQSTALYSVLGKLIPLQEFAQHGCWYWDLGLAQAAMLGTVLTARDRVLELGSPALVDLGKELTKGSLHSQLAPFFSSFLSVVHAMFSRSAFFTGRTPPVPEAFPKSATARGKQKDKNEMEQNQSAPHSPSPETSRASRSSSPIQPQLRDSINESSSNFIGKNASPDHLDVLAEAATSSRAKGAETEARARELIEKEGLNQAERISSIAAEKRHFAEMVQKQAVEEAKDPNHKSLCKKVGEMVGQDLAEVTIYPMLDIEHNDKAMIARVKNLVLSVSLSD